MAGEQHYPASATTSGANETVSASFKAPKWLFPSIIALVAGGGLGSGVVGIVHANAPVVAPSVTKAEVQAEANAAAKAESHATKLEAERQVAETRREMVAAFLQINQRLDKLDAKADQTVDQITELKVDVAGLAAKGRK